jgi:hypothetical protein
MDWNILQTNLKNWESFSLKISLRNVGFKPIEIKKLLGLKVNSTQTKKAFPKRLELPKDCLSQTSFWKEVKTWLKPLTIK